MTTLHTRLAVSGWQTSARPPQSEKTPLFQAVRVKTARLNTYRASMNRRAVAATIFVFLATAGCAGEKDEHRSAATSAKATTTTMEAGAADKFTQTWTKPYDQTTCVDFKSGMTTQQRWTMAADMLVNAQHTDDSEADLPEDSLISEFEAGLATACVIDSMSMTDVGAGLYLTEQERFRP